MGGLPIYIFVTVMVATGIMSPESQKALNSPHAIIEMGWNGSSGVLKWLNVRTTRDKSVRVL